MKISARNQLEAYVTKISEGKVNGIVGLKLPGGHEISANISMKAIEWLQLEKDKPVYAVIKATDIMIALEQLKISARNQVRGTISDIMVGPVNGMVLQDIGKEQKMVSTISAEAIREMKLEKGMDVYAVFKATSVMVGLQLDHISFGLA